MIRNRGARRGTKLPPPPPPRHHHKSRNSRVMHKRRRFFKSSPPQKPRKSFEKKKGPNYSPSLLQSTNRLREPRFLPKKNSRKKQIGITREREAKEPISPLINRAKTAILNSGNGKISTKITTAAGTLTLEEADEIWCGSSARGWSGGRRQSSCGEGKGREGKERKASTRQEEGKGGG